MIEHVWSVLCEDFSISKEDNLISLFKCLEQVDLALDKETMNSDLKIIPVKFNLISFWIIEDMEDDNNLAFKIDLLDPENSLMSSTTKNVEIKKEWKRLRNIAKIEKLSIKEAGRYIFEISQQEKKQFKTIARIPLDVKINIK